MRTFRRTAKHQMSTWGDGHESAVYCSKVKDRWENKTLGRALGTGCTQWLSGVGGRKVAISRRKGMGITQGLGVGRLDAV